MRARNIAIGGGFIVGLAIALSMGQGQLGGGGLTRVVTNSPGLLAGSGTTGSPLTATLTVGTGITGTGSAGSPLTASAASSGWTTDGTTTSTTQNVSAAGAIVTIGADAASAISFTNGPSGVNLYGGTYHEESDEFMWRGPLSSGSQIGWYSCATGGTGAACGTADQASVSGRPGMQRLTAGTTTTGRSLLSTSIASITPTDGTYVNHVIWKIPTLSSATDGFAFQTGFNSSASAILPPSGCTLTYDERNVLGANGSNTHKLVASCCKATVCQHKLLDGSTVCDGSFTSVDTTVAADTWIETEVRMGPSAVEFWADTGSGLTKRCQITTAADIPTAAVAWDIFLLKSVGTTARTADLDYAQIRWTLNSVRSP
jgi:hypothetical protein